MKFHDYVVALEEIARADASVGLTMASHNSLCTGHLYLAGNEAQRKKYLPRLASGQALGGWGLTEPGSGSDAGAARTRAVPRGSDRLGHQRHEDLHHAGLGRLDLRRARLDEPREEGQGAHGVHRRARHARLPHGQAHREDGPARLRHDRARLRGGRDPRRAAPGRDRRAASSTRCKILDKGRIGIGAWAVGIGRAALEASLKYAKDRVQFDKPIAEFQAIQHMLADMATELDAARLLVWRAALMQDQQAEDDAGVGHGEVLRGARDDARLQRRRADPRRLRLHARVRRRALPARRQARRDRRGHERGAEDGHRARAARRRRRR